MKRTTILENRWLTLLEDKFTLPNGADCTYYHVQKPAAIMVIALDLSGTEPQTYVVHQHRHPIEQGIWQFPMGGFDSTQQSPLDVARKELLEETGVVAGDIEYLGDFFCDPGFSDQKIHVCATHKILEVTEQKLEGVEYGLQSRCVPVSSIRSMIAQGDMGDAWGLAGYFYLNEYLEKLQ